MPALHHFRLGGSLLALMLLGCEASELTEPATEVATRDGAGQTVKAPSALKVVATSASRIDLLWKDNSNNEDGFEVHRSSTGAGGTFGVSGGTGPGVTTASDLGVDPSKPFCYQVRAFRTTSRLIIYSGFSNIGCVPAGSLQVTAATTGIDLDPNGYTVTLEVVAEGRVLPVATVNLATNGAITMPALRAGDYYRITLGDIAPNCDLSSPNPQLVTIAGGSTAAIEFDVACVLLTPPAPPSHLATYPYILAIGLTWNDNAVNEDGFRIERCHAGELGCADADFVQIAEVPTLDSRNLQSFVGYYDMDGLLPWTTYVYRVRAFNRAGVSEPSYPESGMARGDPWCEEFGC